MSRILPRIALTSLLFVYALLMWVYFVPITGGTDQNGYHMGARMLVENGSFSRGPVRDIEFVSSSWVLNTDGKLYPNFPPVYPGLSAMAMKLFGWEAGFWICPISAVLALASTFFLVRFFLPEWYACMATLFLAVNPIFAYFSLSRHSHAPSRAFLGWGLVCFFTGVSRRRERAARVWCGVAGLLMGVSVGIRYTNLLLFAVPLAYSLIRFDGRRFRLLLAFAAGAAIPGLILAVFHWAVFGAPWRTAYAMTNEQSGFSLEWVIPHLKLYGKGLYTYALGPLLVLSFIGLEHFRFNLT